MHPFAISRGDDLAKAVAAHAMDGQVAFIAGGTDLLGLMKDRAVLPERLLDITHQSVSKATFCLYVSNRSDIMVA
jgi:CO/xanthine dehydrogenase FAD-binding subunit